MKPTPNQIINMANGIKRIRLAIDVAWITQHVPSIATEFSTMFSKRTGVHYLEQDKK